MYHKALLVQLVRCRDGFNTVTLLHGLLQKRQMEKKKTMLAVATTRECKFYCMLENMEPTMRYKRHMQLLSKFHCVLATLTRFEVITALKIWVYFFWVVTLCVVVPRSSLEMDAARSSEMLVFYHNTTRRHKPELDLYLHQVSS